MDRALPFQPLTAYVDTDGRILNGGYLYFYEAGTSAPKTTWADSAMQTANSNPVELDSSGRATIFVRGLYKVVLKDSDGVTIDTWDYLYYPTITTVAATLLDDTSVANMRTTLGLGTAATQDYGTSGNNIVRLTAGGLLPAVDGSLLTNIGTGSVSAPRGYIAGLELSRSANQTFAIAAGTARDGANTYTMSIASSWTKTFSAWAAGTGNGSLDTGAISPSSWYYAYLIYNATTSATDVLMSANASSPTLPSGWGYSRRIGAFLTDGDSYIVDFFQIGDQFLWKDPPLDVQATGVATSAVSHTLTVPNGVEVRAIMNVTFGNPDGAASLYLSSLEANDEATAGDSAAPLATIVAPAANERYASGIVEVPTNTSKQIRSRANLANSSIDIATLGWWDSRGRDS